MLRIGQLSRWIVLLAVAIMPATSGQHTLQADQIELAKSPYEVRLRKLHLVRPDLISYPIYFEVYC
ncbi:MAG TPA: hypothetical protein VHD56_01635 [Tepidisphaeraceae bacterium]|nr:hypothetical protein [Tepidisphaeraceae bacterium]